MVHGALAIGWSTLAIHGTGLVRTALLARLLEPELFGIVAMAEFLLGILRQVQDFQFDTALVYRQTRVPHTALASLAVKTLLSASGVLLIWSGQGVLSRWYDPRIGSILLWFGAASVVQAIGGTPRAIMEREFRFSELVWVQVASAVVRTVVPVGMALAGYGLMSLAASAVLDMVLPAIGFWWRRPVAFAARPSWADVRWLFAFSAPLWVAAWLSLICYSAGHGFVGSLAGTVALGSYALAFTFARLPVQLITHALSRAMFPAYAKFQHDREALAGLLAVAIRCLCWSLMPVAVVAAGLAPEAMRLVLGPKWDAAVPVFQSLCVFTVFRGLQDHAIDFFNAQGQTHWFRRLMSVEALVLLLVGPWMTRRYGAVGMAWAINLMMAVGMGWVIASLQSMTARGLWQMMRLPVAISALIGVLVAATGLYLTAAPWLVLLAKLGVAVGVGGFSVWRLGRDELRALWSDVRELWDGQWRRYAPAAGTAAG